MVRFSAQRVACLAGAVSVSGSMLNPSPPVAADATNRLPWARSPLLRQSSRALLPAVTDVVSLCGHRTGVNSDLRKKPKLDKAFRRIPF